MPTDAVTSTRRPSSETGWPSARDHRGRPVRRASPASRGRGEDRELVAAEPGHRAAVRPAAAASRSATAISSWSPTSCPSASLTCLNRSRSSSSRVALRVRGRGSRPRRARRSRPCSPVRLASPVSGSRRAARSRSADSRAIRCTAYSGTNTSGTNPRSMCAATASTGLSSSSAALNSIWLAVRSGRARAQALAPQPGQERTASTPYVASQATTAPITDTRVDDDVVRSVPVERVRVAGVEDHRSGREGEPDLPDDLERFAHAGSQPNRHHDDRRRPARQSRGRGPSRAGWRR